MGHSKPTHIDGDIVAIVGKTGSGKTWCATDALQHELVDGKRVVALDITGEIATYLERDGWDGIVRVSSYKEAMGFRASRAKILLFTAGQTKLAQTAQDWLNYLVEQHRPQTDVFVCDEAELVFPMGCHRVDYPLRVMKLIRNWQVRLYVLCQRPQLLDNLLRQNSRHVAVFQADGDLFVGGCHEFGGESRYRPAKKLEQHHYLYKGPDTPATGPLPVFNAREASAPWLDYAPPQW